MNHSASRCQRGMSLVVGFFLIIVLFALAFAFAGRLTSNHQRVESDVAGERAYELAQTANTLKIQQVWADFKARPSTERVAWLGGEDINGNGKLDKGEDIIVNGILDKPHATDRQDANWVQTDSGMVCTRIKLLSMMQRTWVLVRFTTWSQVRDRAQSAPVTRKVQRVVRFSMKPASIFDFAFFATNYGTIDGNKLKIYGSVGANGDINLSNRPIIDGKIYAAANTDTGMAGNLRGSAKFDDFATYGSLLLANPLMRPTNPTAPPEDRNRNGFLDLGEDLNHNGILDNFKYDLGYDGKQAISTQQPAAIMPLLTDLSVFKAYAANYIRSANPAIGEAKDQVGSMVKQLSAPGLDPTRPENYTILINQTYGDNGEFGLAATNGLTGVKYAPLPNKIEADPTKGWKNGNISLIGTPAQPLIVQGPVVITNDLAIQGTITGQGTFFVGRNAHVTGDIVYQNPPQWKPNDMFFNNTIAANKKADMVGFGVRGNIILGNYTDMDTNSDQWNNSATMMRPPYIHTQPVYNQDDNEIGYGNGTRTPLSLLRTYGSFPGDYTIVDGDKHYLDDNTVPLLPNRSYYQSTFSNAYIKSIAKKPSVMNGVFYSGHLAAGRASNLTLFGSLIAYDEGILADGSVTIIYDPRASPSESKSYINLFMPANGALDVIYWKDNQIDDASAASPDW